MTFRKPSVASSCRRFHPNPNFSGRGWKLKTRGGPAKVIRGHTDSQVQEDRQTTLEAVPGAAIDDVQREKNVKQNDEGGGTLWGAMALIIGSTIGAGILALPDITQDAGFVDSSMGLIGVWGFLVGQALLLAEVNTNLMMEEGHLEEEDAKMTTLRAMAESTLGKGASRITTFVYLSLSYCLLVAYLTKVGEIFSFASNGSMQTDSIVIEFTLASLLLFGIGGPVVTDKLNQGLTSVLVAVFVSILVLGLAGTDLGLLFDPANDSLTSLQALGPAIPIMFLSLVYHDLIPLICSYLGGDRAKIRQALILGSIVPLCMFISWEGVSLAFFMNQESNIPYHSHIDPVNLLISESRNPLLGVLVQGFSFTAIATSFLGTTMGVSETIFSEFYTFFDDAPGTHGSDNAIHKGEEKSTNEEILGNAKEENPAPFGLDLVSVRNVALGLTLVPPVIFTTSGDPKAFINVLSIAGGYGMTLLYGIFPPMMAYVYRKNKQKGEGEHLLPGGNAALFVLFAVGMGLMLQRASSDLI